MADRARAPAQAHRRAPREPRDQPVRGRALDVAVRGEVLAAERRLLAPGGGDDVDLGRHRDALGGRHRRARQHLAAEVPERLERRLHRLVRQGEDRGERGGERRVVGTRGAEHGTQRVERLRAVAGVDRGERAMRGQQLADAGADAAGP
jgi:hypothetical protein